MHDFQEDRPELPEAAGSIISGQFEPNDHWLINAAPKLQIEAMRQWFCSRYEDPANSTPYNGREGGYQFINGGPFEPDDQLQMRFSEYVPYEVIQHLVDDLHSEVGDQWAPIDYEPYDEGDYDQFLSMFEDVDKTPHQLLIEKLADVNEVLTAHGSPHIQTLVTQLAYGAAIAALEAYLLETTTQRVLGDESVLRSFVAGNTDPQLGKITLPLSSIFQRVDGIKDEVNLYLQSFVWHRLDKVKPILEASLGIRVPAINVLMKAVVVRHDIVHRGGKNKDGEPVTITIDDVHQLALQIRDFSNFLEDELKKRYPEEAGF
nr:hypothetical protein [uncultured Pseudomonas sp.]